MNWIKNILDFGKFNKGKFEPREGSHKRTVLDMTYSSYLLSQIKKHSKTGSK